MLYAIVSTLLTIAYLIVCVCMCCISKIFSNISTLFSSLFFLVDFCKFSYMILFKCVDENINGIAEKFHVKCIKKTCSPMRLCCEFKKTTFLYTFCIECLHNVTFTLGDLTVFFFFFDKITALRNLFFKLIPT